MLREKSACGKHHGSRLMSDLDLPGFEPDNGQSLAMLAEDPDLLGSPAAIDEVGAFERQPPTEGDHERRHEETHAQTQHHLRRRTATS